jgi:nucleoside-diphosphate kinase
LSQTLVLIKPDGVQRSLIGTIIHRLESKGLEIRALKMLSVTEDLANRHYEAHQGKPFFQGLVSFITSSPVVALVIEGKNAIEVVRNIMGATNPIEAEQGTIRGDFALDIGRNLIHGSDSAEAAEREINLFFNYEDILKYSREGNSWIIES